MRIFWEKGYEGTSLKDLESALSMKPGSIYAAFKSKENLFLLAMERYFHNSLNLLNDARLTCESPMQALNTMINSIATGGSRDHRSPPCFLLKTVLTTSPDNKTVFSKARFYLDAIRQEFASLLREAVQAGELDAETDIEKLAMWLQSQINALRVEAQRDPNEPRLSWLAQEIITHLGSFRS